MTDEKNKPNVHQRLLMARKALRGVEKDGEMTIRGKKTETFTHDGVVSAVNPVMTEAGLTDQLVFILDGVEVTPKEKGEAYRGTGSIAYRLINVDNPTDFFDVVTIPYFGLGYSNQFGTINNSNARREAMRLAFHLSDKDEPKDEYVELTHPTNKYAAYMGRYVKSLGYTSEQLKTHGDDIKSMIDEMSETITDDKSYKEQLPALAAEVGLLING